MRADSRWKTWSGWWKSWRISGGFCFCSPFSTSRRPPGISVHSKQFLQCLDIISLLSHVFASMFTFFHLGFSSRPPRFSYLFTSYVHLCLPRGSPCFHLSAHLLSPRIVTLLRFNFHRFPSRVVTFFHRCFPPTLCWTNSLQVLRFLNHTPSTA